VKRTIAALRFSELLLALLKGKTGLLDALGILAREGIEKPVRENAFSLLKIMKKGKGLSESLRIIGEEKVFFEPLYITLIAAAELTGSIEAVLGRIVSDLQRKQRAKENLMNILIYPVTIVFLAIAGTIGIILKGMPLFISAGLLSVTIVEAAKTGIALAALVLLLGGGALFFVYFRIFNDDSPESRIFYLLDFLMKSNITLTDALSQCVMSLGHTKYGSVLVKIKKDIVSGVSFSEAFARTKCFSPYVLGWLSIADINGNLNEISGSIRDHYLQKESKIREAAAKLIEPAVIVLVGIYVLIIMTTVILPILSYSGGIL
jgi:type II secretory pathway component PulF